MSEKCYAVYDLDNGELALIDGRVPVFWRKSVAELWRKELSMAHTYETRLVVIREDKPKRTR
jgi:hypothetical protein